MRTNMTKAKLAEGKIVFGAIAPGAGARSAASGEGSLQEGRHSRPALHDLRRSVVRSLEGAGVPRSVAMKLTGHKTESIYRRYAIVAESDLREAGVKLSTMLGGAAGSSSAAQREGQKGI
jgi:integrase